MGGVGSKDGDENVPTQVCLGAGGAFCVRSGEAGLAWRQGLRRRGLCGSRGPGAGAEGAGAEGAEPKRGWCGGANLRTHVHMHCRQIARARAHTHTCTRTRTVCAHIACAHHPRARTHRCGLHRGRARGRREATVTRSSHARSRTSTCSL